MSEEAMRYRWWVLCLAVLANFFPTGMAWFYVVVMVTNVCQDLHVGLVDFSKLWAGISLGAFLCSIGGGALGDRLGVRKVVGGRILLMSAALLWRAQAPTFASMLASMVLFGACIALVAPNLPKALGQWFPQREFGFANGAALAGNGAGQAIALSAGPLLLEPLGGWRAITRMLGLVLFGLGVLWIATLRDREGSVGGGGNALASLRAVTRIPAVWVLSGAYMLVRRPARARGSGPAYAGSALGLALTAGFGGGFVSPIAGSTLAAANPFAGIAFWTACYAGSAFLFLLVPETGPRAQREVASAPLR